MNHYSSKNKPLFSLKIKVSLQNIMWRLIMKLKILLTAVAFSLSSASFAGDLLGWNHSCWDNKTALFTDKMNKAIEVASLDRETLLKVDQLTTECHYNVNLGLSTYETDTCKQALEMVGVN